MKSAKIRVETTLFMLSSVDGKISTGSVDGRDIDKDFPLICGVKKGLHQYYDLEKQTDFWSFNTGRVMAKVGMNERTDEPKKIEVLRFVIVDNKPHLNKHGVVYLAKKTKLLVIVTTNKNHAAFEVKKSVKNIEVLLYEKKVDFSDLFKRLNQDFGAKRLTIQSGGTMNSVLLRENLIDHVSLVIAPVLVGGKDTSTLIDGISLRTEKDLLKVKALVLRKCDVLKDSYLHLQYDVVNETQLIKRKS